VSHEKDRVALRLAALRGAAAFLKDAITFSEAFLSGGGGLVSETKTLSISGGEIELLPLGEADAAVKYLPAIDAAVVRAVDILTSCPRETNLRPNEFLRSWMDCNICVEFAREKSSEMCKWHELLLSQRDKNK